MLGTKGVELTRVVCNCKNCDFAQMLKTRVIAPQTPTNVEKQRQMRKDDGVVELLLQLHWNTQTRATVQLSSARIVHTITPTVSNLR